MSHIPSSAMKHAGPTHADAASGDGGDRGAQTGPHRRARGRAGDGEGIGVGAWVAIGGTLLAGAAAAIAVPLLRARQQQQPVPTRRGRKATVRKAKSRKS